MSTEFTAFDSPVNEATEKSNIRAELDEVWIKYLCTKTMLAKMFSEIQFLKAGYNKCVRHDAKLTKERAIIVRLISDNLAKSYLKYQTDDVDDPATFYLKKAKQYQAQLPVYFNAMDIHRNLQSTYKLAIENLENTYYKNTLDNDTYWRTEVRKIYKSSAIEMVWVDYADQLDDCVLSTGEMFPGNALDYLE